MITRLLQLVVLCLLLMPSVQAADEDSLVLGSIEFETSASGEAQAKFILGVKALHSFWFEQARAWFIEARQIDPAFGMAYWGEVMSFDNPLGTVFDSDYESRGEAALISMVALDEGGMLRWNEKEQYWLNAVKQRFASGQNLTEKRRNYGRAMEGMREQFPDDDEVQVFAALAVMSFPGFDREQASHVVLAAAPLEEIYQHNPDHPGALHFLIHVYDTPTFAQLAMRQARRYGQVASSAPHAVHMPSHIYKHLGMLDEMLLANITSWLVSVQWQRNSNRPLHMRDFHTFSWLLDTHLLSGDTEQAARLMQDLADMESQIADRGEDPGHFPATAAMLRQKYSDNTGQGLP
ncbi:hypothetical protein N9E57_03385 [Gammaproteobacteria bacterium]|nr:hypothetical protein [Gammaproteobacteria bacterium]